MAAAALALMAVPAAAQSSDAAGAQIFREHCSACHDAAGAGVPGFGPALAGPVAARLKAGAREYLAQVVVSGITGVFELANQRQLGVMPSFAGLGDESLAAALNHVVFTLNAEGVGEGVARFTGADVAAARGNARTPAELDRVRQALVRAAR